MGLSQVCESIDLSMIHGPWMHDGHVSRLSRFLMRELHMNNMNNMNARPYNI